MKYAIKSIIVGMPAAAGVAALAGVAEAEKIYWTESDLSQPAPVPDVVRQTVAWPPVPLPVPLEIQGAIRGIRN